MERQVRTSRRATIPAGLLGMLVLIVLAEGFARRHEVDYKTSWHWCWRVNGRAAARRAPRFPILCFGDSLVRHGVIPSVLEAKVGRRAYNLALSGGQTPTSYFQLRRALRAGAKPRAVLIDSFPLLLNHGLDANEERWADLLSPEECLELAWESRDAGFFARTMLAELLVSLHERAGIRKSLVAALGGTQASEALAARGLLRNWRLNQGNEPFPKNPNVNLGDLDIWFQAAFSSPRWAARQNQIYLRRFLALAAEHKIPVFWLVPPIHPEVQALFEHRGIDARNVRMLTWIRDRFPNAVILDGRRARYPASVFVDHGHLDREGASVFSSDIGDAVRRTLDAGPVRDRWVALSEYRPLALDGAFEDSQQSRVIVDNEAAKALRR